MARANGIYIVRIAPSLSEFSIKLHRKCQLNFTIEISGSVFVSGGGSILISVKAYRDTFKLLVALSIRDLQKCTPMSKVVGEF